MVVRNHEGGTSGACGNAAPKGACSWEWTRAGDVGGGANVNLMRGGVTERWHQRSREHFEVETKAMRAVISRFRSR